jgi:hypothetical protein
MQRIVAFRQCGTPLGWIAFDDGSAGRYVSHGTSTGSDADAGAAKAHAASAATATAPLPMWE